MTTTTCVYRAFSHDGELLYVGMTAAPASRFSHHCSNKDWWLEVATLSIEHFDSREEAMIAENRAINIESPRHNVLGVARPLDADELRRQAEKRRQEDAERERIDASTWCTNWHVDCSNCGERPYRLPKGVLLSEIPCPGCECTTLARRSEGADQAGSLSAAAA